MDCRRARELVDLHAAGELDGASADELCSHCESCAECGRLLDDARAAARLAAEALRHFEPGDGFERAVLARIDGGADLARGVRVRWRRAGYLVAAAAVLLLAALIGYPRAPGARLSGGRLDGPSGQVTAGAIAAGEKYTAADESAVELGAGTGVLLARGSCFRVDEAEMSLLTGSCYVVTDARPAGAGVARRLSTDGLAAELLGEAEVFLSASGGEDPEPGGLAAAVIEAIFPPVYAAGAGEPGALVVVLAGRAHIELGGRPFELGEGEALFADRVERGPFDVSDYIRRHEADIAAAKRLGAERAPEIARYRAITGSYRRDLAAKRERRAGAAQAELAELELRIALVEEVRRAHEARLAELLKNTAEGRARELRGVSARVELLRSARSGHARALERLMMYHRPGE